MLFDLEAAGAAADREPIADLIKPGSHTAERAWLQDLKDVAPGCVFRGHKFSSAGQSQMQHKPHQFVLPLNRFDG